MREVTSNAFNHVFNFRCLEFNFCLFIVLERAGLLSSFSSVKNEILVCYEAEMRV